MARKKARLGTLPMQAKAAELVCNDASQGFSATPDSELTAGVAAAQIASPPWEAEGWHEPIRNKYPEGELLARMKKRVVLTRGSISLRTVKITPNKEKIPEMTKLKAARKRAQDLGYDVRDAGFADWLSRCVVTAQRPDEWTRACDLYESYLRHAASYGNNRPDKRLSKEELATETCWGKMMGAEYPNKKRRRKGWYYPLRVKRGA